MTQANYQMGRLHSVVLRLDNGTEVVIENPNVNLTISNNTHEFMMANGERRVLEIGERETNIEIHSEVDSTQEFLDIVSRIEQGIRLIRED